jgi:hypothetical protein
MFLCSPALREGPGKAADGEIGWCAAVSDGFDDARRHEGERGEVSMWRSTLFSLRPRRVGLGGAREFRFSENASSWNQIMAIYNPPKSGVCDT